MPPTLEALINEWNESNESLKASDLKLHAGVNSFTRLRSGVNESMRDARLPLAFPSRGSLGVPILAGKPIYALPIRAFDPQRGDVLPCPTLVRMLTAISSSASWP